MTREEAMKVLGIEYAIEPAVNYAFRMMSKVCHPEGSAPDDVMWESITAAKAVLLAPPPKCPRCRGTGRMDVGAIRIFCIVCEGKGTLYSRA